METPDRPGYSAAARISTKMVQLLSRYTGRGPTKARTTLNTNLASVLVEDALTRAEANLVAAGQHASVRDQRRILHDVMRPDAIAIVEAETGRRVRAYLNDVDPLERLAVYTFVLDTRPETGTTAVAEAVSGG